MRQRFLWVLALMVTGLSLFVYHTIQSSGNQPDRSHSDETIVTIATGNASGPYFTIGSALAKRYEEKLGINASVITTGGSVENMGLMETGKADMAFAMSDAVTYVYSGTGGIKEMKDLQAMAGLYLNCVQIITLHGSPIHTVSDLKGKRVGVGAPESGVEVNARMLLEALGITYQDIQPEYLSYTEAVEQLKNQTIDAAFFTSGLPNPSVTELAKSKPVTIVPIPMEEVRKLKETYPFFQMTEIPAGTYRNDVSIPTAATLNVMLVRKELDEELVYKLTRELFESLTYLQRAHQAAHSIDIGKARQNLPIPVHPGAEKYYKEAQLSGTFSESGR
ncbi:MULTISPECIES: TAXI family TRAP transporter solute-binding subunit [Paenibacillus]|uniref:TAXI family TRAP transporter solute-binding subunit n=1 Tax=Paenibacillus TaxID=44249 RepID=UPI0010B38984|nr:MULTISPECIES: TAXI family TRAP transporter solute-binding subunit [Paenibacillus]NTZ16270.1 TAXI family TRAP transporter solute-binding subunit [Paenibacillus sp. JMULE4]GCL72135.1 C4-dicarboxylate ABC transporter substrate-binding protein [Paenibacillus naphthalenovorans]